MTGNPNIPPVRDADATGIPESDKRSLIDDEDGISPSSVPKTSGAAPRGKEPMTNPAADRNTQGIRQSGTTPRPTDKQIVGGDKGSAS